MYIRFRIREALHEKSILHEKWQTYVVYWIYYLISNSTRWGSNIYKNLISRKSITGLKGGIVVHQYLFSKSLCKRSCVGGICTSGNPVLSWNPQGVLYPIDPSKPTSRNRSPYKVSLNDVILEFGTSSHRQNLLSGLLSFRSALHGLGITAGFQWLDGSFFECVESLRACPPNDIDVITFYNMPVGQTQQTLEVSNPQLFDNDFIKK